MPAHGKWSRLLPVDWEFGSDLQNTQSRRCFRTAEHPSIDPDYFAAGKTNDEFGCICSVSDFGDVWLACAGVVMLMSCCDVSSGGCCGSIASCWRVTLLKTASNMGVTLRS